MTYISFLFSIFSLNLFIYFIPFHLVITCCPFLLHTVNVRPMIGRELPTADLPAMTHGALVRLHISLATYMGHEIP